MSSWAYKKAKGKGKLRSPFKAPRRVVGRTSIPRSMASGDDVNAAMIRPLYLKGGRKPELNYRDTTVSTALAGTWSQVCINSDYGINTGTGQGQRVGNKITIKRISFRGKVYTHAANADYKHLFRLVLVCDKACRATDTAYTDIFSVNDMFSHRKKENAALCNILYDRTFSCDETAVGAAGSGVYYVQFSVPCNIPINYIGTAGTVADLDGNHITMWGSQYKVSAANYSSISGYMRITYADN